MAKATLAEKVRSSSGNCSVTFSTLFSRTQPTHLSTSKICSTLSSDKFKLLDSIFLPEQNRRSSPRPADRIDEDDEQGAGEELQQLQADVRLYGRPPHRSSSFPTNQSRDQPAAQDGSFCWSVPRHRASRQGGVVEALRGSLENRELSFQFGDSAKNSEPAKPRRLRHDRRNFVHGRNGLK